MLLRVGDVGEHARVHPLSRPPSTHPVGLARRAALRDHALHYVFGATNVEVLGVGTLARHSRLVGPHDPPLADRLPAQ